jgi:hypothetical protein
MADEHRALARRLAAARAKPDADQGADTANYIEIAELDLLRELPRAPPDEAAALAWIARAVWGYVAATDIVLSLDRLAVHALLPHLAPLVVVQAPGPHPRRPALALGPAAAAPPAAGAGPLADTAWLLKASLLGRLLAQRAEAAGGAPDARSELAAARRLNTYVLVLLSDPARRAAAAAAALAALPLAPARGAGAVGIELVLFNAHYSLWILDQPEALSYVGLCDSLEAHLAATDAAAVARRARVAAAAAGVASARPAVWVGHSLVAAGHWHALNVTARNAGAQPAWAAAVSAIGGGRAAGARRGRRRARPRRRRLLALGRGRRAARGRRFRPAARGRARRAQRGARRGARPRGGGRGRVWRRGARGAS